MLPFNLCLTAERDSLLKEIRCSIDAAEAGSSEVLLRQMYCLGLKEINEALQHCEHDVVQN